MTTTAEVKRWAKPLLDGEHDLVLVGRDLILKPINHIIRGICVDRTSNAHWSNVFYYVVPLFDAPSPSTGFRWTGHITLGRNDAPSFQDDLVASCKNALVDVLRPVDSIDALLEHTNRDDIAAIPRLGPGLMRQYYQDFSVTLAALGRIEEARAALEPMEWHEANFLTQLARGEALVARRANSRIGKGDIHHASFHLNIIEQLKRLRVLLEAGDRVGIGALLHEWELLTIRKWKLEHLWTPSPFPIELGAGD